MIPEHILKQLEEIKNGPENWEDEDGCIYYLPGPDEFARAVIVLSWLAENQINVNSIYINSFNNFNIKVEKKILSEMVSTFCGIELKKPEVIHFYVGISSKSISSLYKVSLYGFEENKKRIKNFIETGYDSGLSFDVGKYEEQIDSLKEKIKHLEATAEYARKNL